MDWIWPRTWQIEIDGVYNGRQARMEGKLGTCCSNVTVVTIIERLGLQNGTPLYLQCHGALCCWAKRRRDLTESKIGMMFHYLGPLGGILLMVLLTWATSYSDSSLAFQAYATWMYAEIPQYGGCPTWDRVACQPFLDGRTNKPLNAMGI
ncbi:hypothetical protein DFH08DRAFT_808449 [Mycena albidolilacea]|uniref:Uncharacterized protein n=1 Tax=Mycena albidolilacea TaxID=1033008 RepID=A0AAD7A3E6_9AGAR|nr:hypothetical protein DFH08DRAFT_808449 [Mycena albidolilacea]